MKTSILKVFFLLFFCAILTICMDAPGVRAATLQSLPQTNVNLLADLKTTAACQTIYQPNTTLSPLTQPMPLMASGEGVNFTAAEVQLWKFRLYTGPFIRRNDYKTGTPDDWTRISNNANAFVARGEPDFTITTNPSQRGTHGTLARDAAFYYLMTNDVKKLQAVKAYLLAQANNPANDFATSPYNFCFRFSNGATRDAWFGEAGWLARYILTYDFVRAQLSPADRLKIENMIRRNAYFHAAHMDWGFNFIFPAHLAGNYTQRTGAIAGNGESVWATKKFDMNGDCQVSTAEEKSKSYPAYTHITSTGQLGNRLSLLTQWYNNRRSDTAIAMIMAGSLLNDNELKTRGKRYFMEWITYGVFPDGTDGEYIRNGDYCIPKQGIIYQMNNIQGSVISAAILARRGDRDLMDFSTTDGLFGTGGSRKSITQILWNYVNLLNGVRPIYFHEAWKPKQAPRPETSLWLMETHYNNGARATDTYHELGLLLGAHLFPSSKIDGLILRDPKVTKLRMPGSTGNSQDTGSGLQIGIMNDIQNIYPSVFLMRNSSILLP